MLIQSLAGCSCTSPFVPSLRRPIRLRRCTSSPNMRTSTIRTTLRHSSSLLLYLSSALAFRQRRLRVRRTRGFLAHSATGPRTTEKVAKVFICSRKESRYLQSGKMKASSCRRGRREETRSTIELEDRSGRCLCVSGVIVRLSGENNEASLRYPRNCSRWVRSKRRRRRNHVLFGSGEKEICRYIDRGPARPTAERL